MFEMVQIDFCSISLQHLEICSGSGDRLSDVK